MNKISEELSEVIGVNNELEGVSCSTSPAEEGGERKDAAAGVGGEMGEIWREGINCSGLAL